MRKIIVICSVMLGCVNLYAMHTAGPSMQNGSGIFDLIRRNDKKELRSLFARSDVKALLEQRNEQGDTPLHAALRDGKQDIFYLLRDMASENRILRKILKLPGKNDEDLISAAIHSGNSVLVYDVVRLIAQYRLWDFKDPLAAPILLAHNQGKTEIVNLLNAINNYFQAHGITNQTKREQFFSDIAPTKEKFDSLVEKKQIAKSTTYSPEDVAELFDKIGIDDVPAVQRILDRFPNNKNILDKVNKDGYRPLYYAFRIGNKGMIDLLVSDAERKGVLRKILKPTNEKPEDLIAAAVKSENLDAIYTAVSLEGAYRISGFNEHLDAALGKAEKKEVKDLLTDIKDYLAAHGAITSEYRRSILFEHKMPTREKFLLLKTEQQGASLEQPEKEISLEEQPVWQGRKTK